MFVKYLRFARRKEEHGKFAHRLVYSYHKIRRHSFFQQLFPMAADKMKEVAITRPLKIKIQQNQKNKIHLSRLLF